jgi:predicted branched-subunit amino acid permease
MNAMAPHENAEPGLWDGVRASAPVVVAVLPFGLLFGAIAVANGLTPLEAVLMSATVYAGASQMVGIELFGQKLAPALIVFSVFAVNFRHVLYSAAIGRRIAHWPTAQKALGFFLLSDPIFAEAERLGESGRPVGFGWYLGLGGGVWLGWVTQTALGAAFGGLISDPKALGLDFLLPIYFLGLVMGFRKRPLWAPVVLASAIASVVAYRIVGSPWHVSIGGIVGILVAAAAPVRRADGSAAS